MGPSILDHVGPDNWAGTYEIFGPVTSIKRVSDFEEGYDGPLSVCVFGWEEKADEIHVRMRERIERELNT
jgi:hypothetical protein